MTFTRKQLRNEEVSHHDYYMQFSTPAIVSMVAGEFSPEELAASTDPHLNDISLDRWDQMALRIRNFISYDLIKESLEYSFSLAFGVCVCKAIAKELKNRSI